MLDSQSYLSGQLRRAIQCTGTVDGSLPRIPWHSRFFRMRQGATFDVSISIFFHLMFHPHWHTDAIDHCLLDLLSSTCRSSNYGRDNLDVMAVWTSTYSINIKGTALPSLMKASCSTRLGIPSCHKLTFLFSCCIVVSRNCILHSHAV